MNRLHFFNNRNAHKQRPRKTHVPGAFALQVTSHQTPNFRRAILIIITTGINAIAFLLTILMNSEPSSTASQELRSC